MSTESPDWLVLCEEALRARSVENALAQLAAQANFHAKIRHRYGPIRVEEMGTPVSGEPSLWTCPLWQLELIGDPAVKLVVEHFRQLATLAYTDTLSGLPNRAHLEAVRNWFHADIYETVGFLDLTALRQINRHEGYAAGDRRIQAIASRLRETLAAGDAVWRYGGDEFVLLCGGETRARILSDTFLESAPAFKIGWGNSLEAAEAAMRAAHLI